MTPPATRDSAAARRRVQRQASGQGGRPHRRGRHGRWAGRSGEVLGSEAELLERYQVSRAVFREAVRLVEHQQVARTRRGPGGGLVITEPTVGAVTDAVVLYLHRVDARLDEIFEARIILEEIACQLASERTDEHDLAQLRRFAQRDPVAARARPTRAARVWWPRSAATPGSSSSSMSSTGWPSCTRRTGNASGRPSGKETRARPRHDRRGHHGRRRRRWRATGCASTWRPRREFFRRRRSTRAAAARLGRAGRIGPGQGRRGGGAPHHPDHRGGGPAAGRAGRHRARADRAARA